MTFSYCYHQTEVCFNHLVTRGLIALCYSIGKFSFFIRREQFDFLYLLQIQFDGIIKVLNVKRFYFAFHNLFFMHYDIHGQVLKKALPALALLRSQKDHSFNGLELFAWLRLEMW